MNRINNSRLVVSVSCETSKSGKLRLATLIFPRSHKFLLGDKNGKDTQFAVCGDYLCYYDPLEEDSFFVGVSARHFRIHCIPLSSLQLDNC